jgi:hypothetical protein
MPRRKSTLYQVPKPKYKVAAYYHKLNEEQAAYLRRLFADKFPTSASTFYKYVHPNRTHLSADMLIFFSMFFGVHPSDLYTKPVFPDMEETYKLIMRLSDPYR